MGKGGVQEVIRVFFYCELNVWMVTVEIFKKNVRGIGFPFCATVDCCTKRTIIPVHWFDERTEIGIQVPFCKRNEFESRKFITKLNKYTKWKFNFHIFWQTRKIETLFKLKDKNIHPSHVIYRGTCTCNQVYIGETARNLEVRVNEHSDINKQSEPGPNT